jgi:hypothetical protein
MSEDGIFPSHRRENLKSYIFLNIASFIERAEEKTTENVSQNLGTPQHEIGALTGTPERYIIPLLLTLIQIL